MRRLQYDPVGHRFGQLTVQKLGPPENNRKVFVQCDCGKTKWVDLHNILRGQTVSCGCWRRNKLRTHGEGGDRTPQGRKPTREYSSWARMWQRCTNPKHPRYADYGGRGIRVCQRWRRYENFLTDMGRCSSKLSLERRNNNRGYSPSNCYWATTIQQAWNQRTSRKVTYKGECLPVTEWARRLSLSLSGLLYRVNQGWPLEKALSTVRYNRGKRIQCRSTR